MIRNTSESWGWPARAFHWIVALMVLGLFGHGLWMEDLSPEARAFHFGLHNSIGISLLPIVAAGFVWWLVNAAPEEPAGTPAWQRLSAHITHWSLYVLTIATVLAGWLLAGTFREPIAVKMFGLIDMPQLLEPGSPYQEPLEEAHELLAYALIALVALHAAAALWHHFVLRDSVLLRMIVGKPEHKP